MFNKIKIAIRRAIEDEYQMRTIEAASTETFEVAPDNDEAAEENGLRLPRPFTRYRPEYPEAAASAEVEATIDLLVEIKNDGEVAQIQVARWAGFGLEESAIATGTNVKVERKRCFNVLGPVQEDFASTLASEVPSET